MKWEKLRDLAREIMDNCAHYGQVATDLAFEAMDAAHQIQFRESFERNRIGSAKEILIRALLNVHPGADRLEFESVVCLAADELERLYSRGADFSDKEIAEAEKIANDIRSGKVETFSLQGLADRMGIRLKDESAILSPLEMTIRRVANRPNPCRPKGSGSIRKKNGGYYAKTSDNVPIGKFKTRKAAEAALASPGLRTGMCKRRMATGSIRFRANRYEVKFREKYVGRYEAREDAEAALARVIEACKKYSI